jgi:hypothetical protein
MIVHTMIPLSDEQSAVLCLALNEMLGRPVRSSPSMLETAAFARERAVAEELYLQLRPVSGGFE